MGQVRHEPGSTGLVQIKRARCCGSSGIARVRNDARNAPVPSTRDQRTDVQLLKVTWDGRVIFDNVPVHIDDVQRTVGAVHQVDGPKPLLSAGQELRLLIVLRTPCQVADTVRFQQATVDHILGVVDTEVITAERRGESVGAVDHLATGRGKVAVGSRFRLAVESDPSRVSGACPPPGIRLAGGIHAGWMSVGRDVSGQIGRGEVWIASQVPVCDGNDVHRMLLIGAKEAISPIVYGLAETVSPAAGRLDRRTIRPKSKTNGTEDHLSFQPGPANRPSTVSATDCVDPIIQPPPRVVDPRPQLSRAEAGKQRLAHFSSTVVVAIGQVQNLGCAQHDHTAARRHDAVTGR